MHTASASMLEALQEAGVSYIFANFGSDHPALIEAIAEARSLGRPIPTIITCPHEEIAVHMAQGYVFAPPLPAAAFQTLLDTLDPAMEEPAARGGLFRRT